MSAAKCIDVCQDVCCSCCCCCNMADVESEDDSEQQYKKVKRKMKEKGYYSQVAESETFVQEIILPDFNKVPLDKLFQMTQPQVFVPIHPQIERSYYDKDPYTAPADCSTTQGKLNSLSLPDTELNFTILYDVKSTSLTVSTLSVKNLPSKEHNGITTSLFVVLFLLPHREDILHSKTHCNMDSNLVPFNETFVFTDIPISEIRKRTLVIRVIDGNSNNVLGNVMFPLHKTDLHGKRHQISAGLTEAHNESGQFYGDIQLTLRYDLSISEVSGVVVKASGLRGMDIRSLSDPCVEIAVYVNGRRKYKWKSSIATETLNPLFNQEFKFDMTGIEMEEVVMKFVVRDTSCSLMNKDDFMGMVDVGMGVDHPTGCGHWKEVVDNPNTRVTRWHSLDQTTVGLFNLT